MTTTADSEYYTKARSYVQSFWDAWNGLKTLQAQWNALDYGNTLPDGEGTNEGLTRVEVGAALFATTDAITGVLNNGHATNLAKLLY